MFLKVLLVVLILFTVVGAKGFFTQRNTQKSEDTLSNPSVTLSITQTSDSVSSISNEDVIRRFFALIHEKKISEAIAMQSKTMVPDESTQQQWGVTWNAFNKAVVLSITPSNVTPPTDTRKTYRVDLDVEIKPNSQVLWATGKEVRWVTIEKEGDLWKISEIATGP